MLIKNFDAMNATYQAQAMFKILYRDPPMPETLSAEGKDFLRRCFLRNPAERPSAMALLEHPFVCKSSDLTVSASTEAPPAVNLTVSIKFLLFKAKNISLYPKSAYISRWYANCWGAFIG